MAPPNERVDRQMVEYQENYTDNPVAKNKMYDEEGKEVIIKVERIAPERIIPDH